MRRGAAALAAILVLGLGLAYPLWYEPTRFAVDIGAGMLSKQLCSCVYVAGRGLADCRADQFESMDPIQAELTSDPEGTRAWLPGFGERVAVYRDGLGCTLE